MESENSCPLHNSYLSNSNFAATTAVIVAASIYIIYILSSHIIDLIYKIFTVSININGPMEPCGDLHRFILDWLHKNCESLQHQAVTSQTEQDELGKSSTKFLKSPAFEQNYYFKYNGILIQVRRTRLIGVVRYDTPWESVTLRVLRWNKSTLQSIESELLEMFKGEEEDTTKTRFFFAQDGSYWMEFGSGKRKRPLDSVILNESLRSVLVNDVHEFLSSEKWYRDRGIPYRRGYLLYGAPGNGKSSFVKAIAGEIGYNICILSLSAKNLNDDSLNHLMNSTEEKCIILLEDIDAAFPSRQQQEGSEDEKPKKNYAGEDTNGASSGKVTLRGLLNALDGVASTEGRIVFLTTNYIEKLDPAMTRPGRVDMKVYINYPDDDQLIRMFKRFYPEASDDDSTKFLGAIRDLKQSVSMAMVQGLFMMYKESYTNAIENIDKYFNEQFFVLQ